MSFQEYPKWIKTEDKSRKQLAHSAEEEQEIKEKFGMVKAKAKKVEEPAEETTEEESSEEILESIDLESKTTKLRKKKS